MEFQVSIKDKIYIFLCTGFISLIITGNLIYQKFVHLPVFNLYVFELSAGAIFYPLTFLLTDLITEFYGKDHARFCVRLSIVTSTLITIMLVFISNLEATIWSKIDNSTFNQVFGGFGIAFTSSLIANYIAQTIDINIYLWLKKLTNGNHLWLRNTISTAISLLIDTTIIIGLLSSFGILPFAQLPTLIFNSYLFKFFFTLSTTPLFYAAFYFIKNRLSLSQAVSIVGNPS
jgi:uncharacterized integral membrane protein (TIGR00697 family)